MQLTSAPMGAMVMRTSSPLRSVKLSVVRDHARAGYDEVAAARERVVAKKKFRERDKGALDLA